MQEPGHKHTEELIGRAEYDAHSHSRSYCTTGSYTGNGDNNRQITGLGFDPKVVIVMEDNGGANVWSFLLTDTMASWKTFYLDGTSVVNNAVDIITDGFELNNGHANDMLNRNGWNYHWIAWG